MFVVPYAPFTATSAWVDAYCAIILLLCFQYHVTYSRLSKFQRRTSWAWSPTISCQPSTMCTVSSRNGPHLAFWVGGPRTVPFWLLAFTWPQNTSYSPWVTMNPWHLIIFSSDTMQHRRPKPETACTWSMVLGYRNRRRNAIEATRQLATDNHRKSASSSR